jgi:hypothetical protein
MNPSGSPASPDGPCIQSASIKIRGWRLYSRQPLVSGAVAQLGERLICIQEVAGSIPTSSTSSETTLGL